MSRRLTAAAIRRWTAPSGRAARRAVIALLTAIGLTHALGVPRATISRAELGIAADETARLCTTTALHMYDASAVTGPVNAAAYLPYAVASLNAYDLGEPNGFSLARHSPEWHRVRTVERPTGLRFDVYHRREAGLLSVLVAYAGSDAYDLGDWQANLAWFTAWLPIYNQYDDARETFREVRAEAYRAARPGERVTFLVTGHSLGGGIAQHVAYAFPCTSAPIFNASFVVLKYRLGEPFTGVPIVHIYEDLEPITRLRRLLFVDRATAFYQHYRVKAVDMREFAHSITGLAVGIARNALACRSGTACDTGMASRRAGALYCPSFGRDDPSCLAPDQ